MVMDDILWQQAFVAHRRHIEEVVPGQTIVGPKEKRLWRLFRMGLVDPSSGDRPRPDATRYHSILSISLMVAYVVVLGR